LPVFLDSFFGPRPDGVASATIWLREVGLGADLAHRIASEIYTSWPREENPLWHNMRSVMARTGLLGHAPTHSILAAAGWV
jgi:hypothetical protein